MVVLRRRNRSFNLLDSNYLALSRFRSLFLITVQVDTRNRERKRDELPTLAPIKANHNINIAGYVSLMCHQVW